MKHTLIAIFLIKTFVTNAQLSVADTLPINHKNYLQQLVTPASLFVGAGIAALNFNPSIDQSIYNKRNSDFANFNTNADDYLQFAPIVLAYGFEVLKLHSAEAIVNPGNHASIKLLKKHGFTREGYFKENYYFEGHFFDSAVYSLLTTFLIVG